MIKQTSRTADGVVGFEVSGTVTKDDYQVLTPALEKAIDANGTIAVVLEMSGFDKEKISAWGADMHFGHEFHNKITRMAIVGLDGFDDLVTKIAAPFYTQDLKQFDSGDTDAAWKWAEGK